MAYTQDNRHISITTPLGKDVLLLKALRGQEAMSRLFSYELDLLSETNPAIDFDDVVGKNVTISMVHAAGTRFINGIVRRFSQGPGDRTFASYRAEVVPWLWLLTQTSDCRIFQNMTVPDIIRKIFTDSGFTDFKFNLVGTFQPREYCVQYRETDFNFVSRLMEQYGIFYFFEHEAGKHTLVIGNTTSAHQPSIPSRVQYQAAVGGVMIPDNVVTDFSREQELRPSKYSLTDYNFETPSVKLAVNVESVFRPPTGVKFEMYDYPGEYAKRDEGEALVRLRMEEEEVQRVVVNGDSGCVQFTPGFKFDLSGHARADTDGSYVLLSVTHAASELGYEPGRGEGEHSYSNTFTCIPAAVPYRAPRTTPRPVIQGSQTAEVVGPKGEEIYTDKHGRVKVQFHWDREGKKDENSSCWIRVSHPWAGKGWGSVSIPRIGQEVIIDFIEGDPDQPIITGRVYNGELMPPYPLPAGGVVSGLKSNSTKGGGGYNEISMNDTKGKEMITVHGQYDMSTDVEHDVKSTIGNDESLDVSSNRTRSVGGNETVSVAKVRTHSVGVNEAITVGAAQEITVGGLQLITVGAKQDINVGLSQNVSIGRDRSTDVGASDELTVGKKLTMEAGSEIQITTGSANLTMKKDGTIIIKGKDITIEGTGKINVKASQDVTVKGQKILQN